MVDRLSVRQRPPGYPVLHQRWRRLLFLHWPFAPQEVRPLVPPDLELDLYDGIAWVGLTPFSVSRLRPSLMPPVPILSRTDEINLRVYVLRDGVPGIWFPSLDASNPLAVWGARLTYGLPYYRARMRVRRRGRHVSFHSVRSHRGAPDAALALEWEAGERRSAARPGTLEEYLVERYVLYTRIAGRLMRARIHHRPWPLRNALVTRLDSTMLEAAGLPSPAQAPLVHAQAEPFSVAIWPPTRA